MRPNILFICTDQQRRHACGFWQREEYQSFLKGCSDPVLTPNIDRLADEGIVVSEAYSSYPVCSPFRAMLFSGRYPARNGVWQNCAPGRPDELRADIPTFTDVLSHSGYNVGYVGKWHLEKPCADFDRNGEYIAEWENYGGERYFADGSPEDAPTCWDTLIPRERQRKIDYLYAYNTYDVFRYHTGDDMRRTPRLFDKDYKRHIPAPGTWSADHETDIAIKYIKNEHGEREKAAPFALFVNYNPPHSPYSCREDTDYAAYDYYAALPTEERMPKRENVTLAGEKFEENAHVYYSHVSGIDRCVGRMMQALRDSGLDSDTIIIYTSDHGEMLGSHGLMAKNMPYEEATAIPFIIRWHGRLAHRVEPLMLTAVDMMPTVLGLCNAPKPEGLDGTDFSALLETGEGAKPTAVLFTQQKRKGVRTADYLFTVAYGNEREHGELLLFDLRQDPYQLHPLMPTDIPAEDMSRLCSALGELLSRSADPWFTRRLYPDIISYPS